MTTILDTSAVLTMLWDEPGGDRVAAVAGEAMISSAIAIEIVSKLIDRGFGAEDAAAAFRRMAFSVVDLDEALAVAAGRLRAATRHRGLSLADRACLALALREEAPALTADRAWAALDVGVEIEVIR